MYWPSSMTIVRTAPLRPGHTGSPSGLAIFTCSVKTLPLLIEPAAFTTFSGVR